MRRLILWGLVGLGLAACVEQRALPVSDVSLLRNPTAPLGSQVDVTAQDMARDWAVRQSVGAALPVAQGRLMIAQAQGGLVFGVGEGVCLPQGPCAGTDARVLYTQSLAGRWALSETQQEARPDLPQEIWVYWMDFDRRTVAIGDPDGRFVLIMDQEARGGGDRIVAAREILEWYGYDVSRLAEVRL